MHPQSNRRLATRIFTSHVILTALAAAALSFIPLREVRAQHGGHGPHDSHGTHRGHGAAKPSPSKARGAAVKEPRAHGAHPGMGMPRPGQPGPLGAAASGSTGEFQVAHERMMRNMALPYTGDPDVDFRVQMIPHHQGAIDMARVALRHAKDPWTRQLAEAVIVEQQREIAEMQAWLARRGAPVPAGGQPLHVLRADSFRSMPEEPGTRAELRGQSWAPGSGIPPQR